MSWPTLLALKWRPSRAGLHTLPPLLSALISLRLYLRLRPSVPLSPLRPSFSFLAVLPVRVALFVAVLLLRRVH